MKTQIKPSFTLIEISRYAYNPKKNLIKGYNEKEEHKQKEEENEDEDKQEEEV